MGTREKAAETDFSGVPLEEEVEEELKESAVISMGTEISPVDLLNIISLCDQARRRFYHPLLPWIVCPQALGVFLTCAAVSLENAAICCMR
jgi:hypothetical protein